MSAAVNNKDHRAMLQTQTQRVELKDMQAAFTPDQIKFNSLFRRAEQNIRRLKILQITKRQRCHNLNRRMRQITEIQASLYAQNGKA